jgi:hypothetical protein
MSLTDSRVSIVIRRSQFHAFDVEYAHCDGVYILHRPPRAAPSAAIVLIGLLSAPKSPPACLVGARNSKACSRFTRSEIVFFAVSRQLTPLSRNISSRCTLTTLTEDWKKLLVAKDERVQGSKQYSCSITLVPLSAISVGLRQLSRYS